MKRNQQFVEEPTMSDKTLLLNVEDLINTAFGTADRNVVNFKMIQAVLHILARQMRLLEQDVEIKVDEFGLAGKPLEAYASEAGLNETKKAKRGRRKAKRDGDRMEDGGTIGRSYDEDEEYDDRDYDRSRDRGGGKARGRRKDDDRDGDRGSSRGRDRDYDEDEERGGSRGRDRDYDEDGERGGSRGRDRDDDRGGEKEGSRGRDRDDDRGGERGGSRGRDRDDDRGGERGGGRRRDRDDDEGGERGGSRGRDRDDDRGGERGGSRGRDRDGDRGGERGGSRGRDGDDDRGGERGGSRGRDRDDDRGGVRGGSRGRDRDDDRGGERGGGRGRDRDDDRGGERGGGRGRDRDDDRGGERGGDRSGGRGSDRGGDKGGRRDGDRGGERGGAEDRGRDRGGEAEGGGRGKGGRGGGGGGGGAGGRDEYADGARDGGRAEDRGGDRGRDRGGGRNADREGRGGERGRDTGGDKGGGTERGGDREDSRGRQKSQKEDYEESKREKGGDRGGRGKKGYGGEGAGGGGGGGGGAGGGSGRGAMGAQGVGGSSALDSGAASIEERAEEERVSKKMRTARSAERMKAQKSGTSSGRSAAPSVNTSGSRTSITVTEAKRKGLKSKGGEDKVLVVGKGRTSGGHVPRVGSIDVVTASQFALLEKAVHNLQKVAGPLPTPSMPDNQRLRQDLAKGTASLTDTMKAMQLTARVSAAERGLTQMAGLLTQLAATGALPAEMASRIGEVGSEFKRFSKSTPEVARQPVSGQGPGQAPFVGPLPGQATGQWQGQDPGQFAEQLPGQVAGQIPGSGQGMPVSTGARKMPPGSRVPPSSTTGTQGVGQGGVGHGPYSSDTGGQAFTTQPSHGARAESTATGMLPWEPGAGAPESVSTSFRKSVAIDPGTGMPRRGDGTGIRPSMGGRASDASYKAVTHAEMEDVLLIIKDDFKKTINTMTARATHSADVAVSTSKGVAEKMDLAERLDKRITLLNSQAADYAAQLSGFDSGLTTQMASFQEQMAQVRTELKEGLDRLEQATTNAESAESGVMNVTALLDLTDRYQGLVIELEHTLHTHQGLTTLQQQLSDELRSLVECVEMLREQKADRDEVFDGLRDKADISRLTGLLHETDFMHARLELDNRLMHCYEKFTKQDMVWLTALKDLSAVAETKAEIIQLMVLKDSATMELKNIQAKLRQLYIMLGEPKAAVLMRKLAKGAACGACLTPALMELTEPKYGKPFAMPQFRPPPIGEEEPCLTKLKPLVPADTRTHVCRRWAGGSHTLVSEHVSHERAAPPALHGPPTKRYAGYGTDGRLYMLEEELQPCLECNQLDAREPGQVIPIEPKPSPNVGAGDQIVAEVEPPKEKEEDKKNEEKENEKDKQGENEGDGDNASLASGLQ